MLQSEAFVWVGLALGVLTAVQSAYVSVSAAKRQGEAIRALA